MQHRSPSYRRRRVASYAAVVVSAALTYVLPLAALKLALTLGWYAA